VRLDPPTPRHARIRDFGGLDRLVALLIVGVFGAALLQTSNARLTASSAIGSGHAVDAAAAPAPQNTKARVVVQPERVVAAERHAATKAPARRVAAKPVAATPAKSAPKSAAVKAKPYVPTGTGMWIYQWHSTAGGSAATIVRRAKWAGLSSLYLRTGSSWDGFTGAHALPALLRATRGTDISVIAWDFPKLRNPAWDARRLAHAAWVNRGRHTPHVVAVAPDIETPAEGTHNAAWRVRWYLRVLRSHLPKGVTILSTVPWPSIYRMGEYPYGTVAAHSDALVPMAYWYNNPPGYVTTRSIRYLRQFHKPVAPVGQGYDGKLDVPSLRHNDLSRQVPVFLRTAKRVGAHGVSIWSWQNAKTATWNALARARHWFRPQR